MNSKSCDTCKDGVDDYDGGGYKDFGEFNDHVMCDDCIEEDKKEDEYAWSEAKKNWEKSSVIEKAYFVRVGELSGDVVVFTDMGTAPKWDDIEETKQFVLKCAMDKVFGA